MIRTLENSEEMTDRWPQGQPHTLEPFGQDSMVKIAPNVIEAHQTSLTYPDGTPALKPFDLEIRKGEVVFVTGPSGSGKTSLLKLFMGIEYPTTGNLKVLGQSIKVHQEREIRKMRCQVGPIFQDFRLLEGRTVYENVMLGLRFLDFDYKAMKSQALESIVRVGLESKIHQPISSLSWGECQRVTIARAVARRPALIIADEPTGNLDRENALKILQLLTAFKSEETAVVITTHATHLIDFQQPGLYLSMSSGVFSSERRDAHV